MVGKSQLVLLVLMPNTTSRGRKGIGFTPVRISITSLGFALSEIRHKPLPDKDLWRFKSFGSNDLGQMSIANDVPKNIPEIFVKRTDKAIDFWVK